MRAFSKRIKLSMSKNAERVGVDYIIYIPSISQHRPAMLNTKITAQPKKIESEAKKR